MADVDLTSSALGGEECFPLASLPNELLLMVLSHTTPCDVGRLAAVSKAFAAIASSDEVWRAFLPANIDEILRNVHGNPLAYQSLKGLYDRLADHIALGDHGSEGFWLDRKTGGVCRSYSARSIRVVWGDTERYWNWFHQEGSRFAEVACLRSVCWFELTGEVRTHVPPGMYTLSWILQFDLDESDTWRFGPVAFNASTTDGIQAHQSQSHFPCPVPGREANDNWWEYDVCQFAVEKGDGPLGELNVKFSMEETSGYWKSGVYVDGVVIRPSSILEPPTETSTIVGLEDEDNLQSEAMDSHVVLGFRV